MGFRGRGTAIVTTGAPTASIEIGDPFLTGGAGLAADAQHQHAFPAPAAGYVTDVGSLLNDGALAAAARADHTHRIQALLLAPGGGADLSAVYARRGATADGLQYVSIGGLDTQDGLSIGAAKATVAAALAALPAGGGVVLHGAGTYDVAAGISVPSNVLLLAILPGTVTIRATADIGAAAPAGWLGVIQVRDPAGAASRTRVALDGITIDANGQANTPALSVQGVTRFYARRCIFKGAGASAVGNVVVMGGNTGGPAGVATDHVMFDGCEIGNSATSGLVFAGGSGAAAPTVTTVALLQCNVHDNAGDGVTNFMAIQLGIRDVLFDDCDFVNNGTGGTVGVNRGHINDSARNGWMDTEVRGCTFGQAGSDFCGGFSDHGGWNVRLHHNTFRLGVTTIWPIALGVSNGLAATKRTRFMWIEDNYFEGNNTFDWDSSTDIFVRRNVFYRVNGRPLGIFGDHLRNEITDNFFVECGQGAPANAYEKAGISLGSGGVAVRRNVFVDNQAVPTMLAGVVEIAGGNLTGPVIYEDNDMAGVGTPLTEVATYDTVRIVKRNKGINPKGAVVIGLGASPYTYTAGESPEIFMVRSSGSGVNVAKGGVQIVANAADGAGTNTAAIALEPREQIVVTYPGPTAPTCYTDVR